MGTARPSTGLATTAVEGGELVFRLNDPEHAHDDVKVASMSLRSDGECLRKPFDDDPGPTAA